VVHWEAVSNHFIELQYDELEPHNIYVMLHSGSRNIGAKIGDYFTALAKSLNDMWYSEGRESLIPFLPAKSDVGQAYLRWLDFALRFAFMNRQLMMKEAKRCLEHKFPSIKFLTKDLTPNLSDGVVNAHHNYTTIEQIYGKALYVHRKGAILARENVGIIPGSMGSTSYITVGKNNHRSLFSSSHGAGRKMGRKAFNVKMKHSHAQIEKELEDVVHSKFGTSKHGKDKGLKDVSECPQAYKDVEEVMSYQQDLVEPLVKMGSKPLICMKG